jgi:serine protease Do
LEFSKFYVGDTITVQLIREGKEMEVKVCYLPTLINHVAERFTGGKSVRLDSFKKVLVHDAAIKAVECGGPVFNSKGEFYGINIARVSRTSTIMLPYDVVRNFLEKSL